MRRGQIVTGRVVGSQLHLFDRSGSTLQRMNGRVLECWRYPVKSMQGARVDGVTIGARGVEGDRGYALLDATSGRILSAKSVKDLLYARIEDDTVVLPDGTTVALDDPGASKIFSEWLGRDVRLATPVEGEQRSYQMTFDPPNDDAEYVDIPAPPGSFVDLAPVHLITTATLAGCRAERPDLDWDVRRFRPNLLIDVDGPPFMEDDWTGQRLRIGDRAVLEITAPLVRCAMPLRAQPGLERQAELFRAMSELNTRFPNHLGVAGSVHTEGRVTAGDPVSLDSG
jgi:uncharacterized protein